MTGTMTWAVHVRLHQIQPILRDRVTHIPIYELAFMRQ